MPKSKFSNLDQLIQRAASQRALIFSTLIIGALVAFEIFNYSTTEFAMSDLLGDLKFGGMRWATILALAFCGIDFAGIARLFTPEVGADEPNEVWYLFGAWMLAATMNATLTWWGVSIAILQHQSLGNAVIDRETLLKVVPIFVAVMVWLSRVLIIGTFSVAGERLFQSSAYTASTKSKSYSSQSNRTQNKPTPARRPATSRHPSYSTRSAPTPPQRSYSTHRASTPPQRAYSTSFTPAPKPQSEEKYNQSPMSAHPRNTDNHKSFN